MVSGRISGDGSFTKRCHSFFQDKFSFKKCLITTSCTAALEMAAILTEIGPGDEVIMPSYTFVSTANAFILRGAKVVFIDSHPDCPGIDENLIEQQITNRTKAIVPVHYAGFACDMDKIMGLADKYNLFVIEDAAQAIDGNYKSRPLGSIGHLSTFSFHETKNVISGEGGMLVVNDPKFIRRAEIIWEKGTNRSAFFRGEVDKYNWVDIGSSFLPSEIIAAFLLAQLENLDIIQERRREVWELYQSELMTGSWEKQYGLPKIPSYSSNNYHLFYMICKSQEQRSSLIKYLKAKNISAVFHYQSLHKSPYYLSKHDGRELRHADRFSDCLVRLPLYFELTKEEQRFIIDSILEFFGLKK